MEEFKAYSESFLGFLERIIAECEQDKIAQDQGTPTVEVVSVGVPWLTGEAA